MRKQKIFLIVFSLSILLNIIFSFIVYQNSDELSSSRQFVKEQEAYPLLSKRILQEFPQDVLINFLDLRMQLRKEVAPFGDTFGFYFEYLPTGTSIGIHEKDEFHAASLFKLPVVMAYYRALERDPGQKDKQVLLEATMLDKRFGSLWQKGEGYPIALSEAVKLALIESDNTAAKVLVPHVTRKDFASVYEGLDINLDIDDDGAILTAKNYASILKALYFSSVLEKDSSEEILDLLTKTKFPDKLAAGVPANIPVAHKIGDFIDKSGKQQVFTDCGIVYVPRRPYVLCLLSVSNEQVARERMQLVSRIVYDYISSVQ